MEKDFSVEMAVSINYEGSNYDLHNCYDFKELQFEVATHTVLLKFDLNPSAGNPEKMASSVVIQFADTDHFELSKQFAKYVNHELSEMGYKNPGDRDYDWLINENKSERLDHMVFRFVNDEYIRIHSRWATLLVE